VPRVECGRGGEEWPPEGGLAARPGESIRREVVVVPRVECARGCGEWPPEGGSAVRSGDGIRRGGGGGEAGFLGGSLPGEYINLLLLKVFPSIMTHATPTPSSHRK
jgi:hypothetical protein